jgi:hypothetical protein
MFWNGKICDVCDKFSPFPYNLYSISILMLYRGIRENSSTRTYLSQ